MTLSQLFLFLDQLGKRPSEALSQNFLIDANIVQKFIQIANISPGDSVLEIGPGPGAITKKLLQAGATVYAIEKDTVFANALHRLQTNDNRLIPLSSDFLDFDLKTLPTPLKVVANLPFHITTPILEKLFEHQERFTSFTLLVQKEFAMRMAAQVQTKEYSSFSLFTQFHCDILASWKVASSCFYPKPKVDSRIVHLVPTTQTITLTEKEALFTLIRRAFQQRRKMLRASLRFLYPTEILEYALTLANAPCDARPEALSLAQWFILLNILSKKTTEFA